ncbi:hypothetical protein F4604DRAFT_1679858 [Suillus subluteus]|nr:hypothetical protein F4604DRAFT_1679858 [Suillus subluteus]
MTIISSDPIWWPVISGAQLTAYFIVVTSTVIYLSINIQTRVDPGQRQRWSLMTLLYVGVRYVGILYSVYVCEANLMILHHANEPYLTTSIYPLSTLPFSMTDELWVHLKHLSHEIEVTGFSGTIFWFAEAWISVVVNAMLGVIMMARIHAMYQRSKKMLIFLVVVLLASTITSGVIMGIATIGAVGEEYVLSGYRVCVAEITSNAADLSYESLISTAIWEILVLCLAVWIVIKHFRELQQSPSGSTIGGCFMALTKSHVFYFLVFVVAACLTLGAMSPNISGSFSTGASVYNGLMMFAQALQMFVLGPRLILSIREYNAKIVARSDEGTCMTSIAFQAGGDAVTSGDV